jgi:two-component system LytT family response regulator
VLLEKNVPEIQLVATTTDCHEGIAKIEQYKPDIVFLDVSMPDMNGFSLLQQVVYKDFHLIFTTAHEQYAIQAIKHHATDYLLKPIDVDELKHAVQTVMQERQPQVQSMPVRRLELDSRIGLPIREGLVYHTVSDIIWVESHGNYCTFHTGDGKKYMVSKNIGEYEEILPEREFFRAHKSHLINMRKVKKYIRTDGYFVEMADGATVEISRRKKDEFLQLMNGTGQ